MRVSHETIYLSLFVQSRGALRKELTRYLRTGRGDPPTRGQHARRTARASSAGTVNISERPAEADDRAVPGHWEGDLIFGRRPRRRSRTLVERQTRFVMLVALPNGHTADVVADALAAKITELPEQLRRSLTWDQGKEMAEHARFTVDTGVPVYFCDPRSPWQRGSNENTNGLLRQYFPKGKPLPWPATQPHSDAVADELNGRPLAAPWAGRPRPRRWPRSWTRRRRAQRVDGGAAADAAAHFREGRRAVSGAAPPASRLLRIACGDGPCGPAGPRRPLRPRAAGIKGQARRRLPRPAHGTPRGPARIW